MSTTCNACGKSIHSLDYMDCKNCKHLFDLECLTISVKSFREYSDEYKHNWVCPLCLASQPKKNNASTPIRSLNERLNNTYTRAESGNINTVRGSRNLSLPCDSPDITSEVLSELRQLRMEIAELKQQGSQISILRAEIQELKSQLGDIPTTLTQKLNDYESLTERQDKEISQLKNTVQQLQGQVSLQEQAAMRNELEIHGIDELDHENLQQILNLTSIKYGVELSDADVDGIWRAGPRSPRSKNAIKRDWKPRPIVVKLVRRAKRDELIKAAKSRRDVTTENVVAGNPSKISLYERLSKTNRSLFRDARQRIRQHNFSFCWVVNGLIYVRKTEKAPPISIRSLQELNERVGLDISGIPQHSSDHQSN